MSARHYPLMLDPSDLNQLIRARRTHKRFGGAAVPRQDLQELVAMLAWAPNHRLTQPWRVRVLEQDAVAALGSWLLGHVEEVLAASSKPEKDRAKIEKLAAYYFSSIGAVLQITQVIDPDPATALEDYGAVCAGVQNCLLLAEAKGLAAFWSTSSLMANPVLLRQLGIDPGQERLVASLWLGSAVDTPPIPARNSPASYTTWISKDAL
ncbi:MAG: hypothetical protein EA402_05605 [Planctomycetota bacterium]|nr:MAG: hypothetical protein EA402_05605 [Planctomycetota bacterium]